MLLMPYQADVPMQRWPIGNWLLLGGLLVAFVCQASDPRGNVADLAVRAGSPLGYLTYAWAHTGPLHLIGNMVFLWVFGNAVCAKLGSAAYLPVYVGLALVAAGVHMAFDGRPAVGASGAINGIVGMYLVLYPLNSVSCFYWVLVRIGTLSLSGLWLIALWLVFDIWGAVRGTGGTAYFAHLGGFFAGIGLTAALLTVGLLKMDPAERSLLDVLGRGRAPRRKPEPAARAAGNTTRGRTSAGLRPETEIGKAKDGALAMRCPCGQRLNAPASMAGKRIRCPVCRQPLLIPAADHA